MAVAGGATTVHTSDGRRLTAESWGDPHGTPVFLLHGTPGSRCGPIPRASVLYRLAIRLISYDRPGYGDSTRHPNRKVADAAADVRAIAEAMDIPTFGVVGRSGGGPHALACAALLPKMVTRVAVLVSVAPSNAEGLDWYDGMTPSNTAEYSKADADSAAAATALAERARRIRDDPESLLRFLLPELTGEDQRIVGDVAIRRLLSSTYHEALRTGPSGWVDDILAMRAPWGFDPGAVEAPTMLWHGADDKFSPVAHSYWLADQIRDVQLEVQPGAAHFGAVEVLPRILAWIKEPEEPRRHTASRASEGLGLQRANQPAFCP